MHIEQVKLITGGPKQFAYKYDKKTKKLTIWIDRGMTLIPKGEAEYAMVLEGKTTWVYE